MIIVETVETVDRKKNTLLPLLLHILPQMAFPTSAINLGQESVSYREICITF